jgi:UDP-glucuronate decarboxylase
MLELAKKYNATLLQFSTSEVYGDALVHPQAENYWGNVNPDGIRSCYDEGKRCAETLCFDYNREFGTHIKVIRIFNTYGPHMHPYDGRVVSNFIVQALQGKDLTIYGDGQQSRSFQYVDDLLNAIEKYMAVPRDELKAFFQKHGMDVPVLNVGNPGEFTIKELAEITLELLPNTGSKLVCEPLPKDDPKRRRPDITLAKELLGWEPRITLREGLPKTIEYFKKLIEEK